MLVRMQRESDKKFADVHPDMVAERLPYGWTIVSDIKPPVTHDVDLQSLVDDRALPHLAELEIYTVDDFLQEAESDIDTLIALPYVTARTVAKVRGVAQ